MTERRRCKKCGTEYPATREFFGSTPSGNLRGSCRECGRKASRQHDLDNPEAMRQRSRHRHKRADHWIPPEGLKEELYLEQGGHCVLCGGAMLWDDDMQIEHLTPVSRGGTIDRVNLGLAHRKCNQEKKAKTMPEYAVWRKRVGLPEVAA